MKKLISIFAFCLAMLFVVGSVEAQDHHRRNPHHYRPHQAPHQPPLFQCRAYSAYAFGLGISRYEQVAVRIALNECAARTPYGHICYIDWCRRVR